MMTTVWEREREIRIGSNNRSAIHRIGHCVSDSTFVYDSITLAYTYTKQPRSLSTYMYNYNFEILFEATSNPMANALLNHYFLGPFLKP